MKLNLPKLTFSILVSLSAGGIGSFFTASSIPTWYSTLNKPFFNPPNWIFAPVWTTLYVLMGISLYLILVTKTKKNKTIPISIFATQLVLNTLWSILFFGLKSPLIALIEIILLWITILFTIKQFNQIFPISSYLLYPYLAWVSFASLLNLAIFLLN